LKEDEEKEAKERKGKEGSDDKDCKRTPENVIAVLRNNG
jgi:hypothetical protein